jgi:hypothetical protein
VHQRDLENYFTTCTRFRDRHRLDYGAYDEDDYTAEIDLFYEEVNNLVEVEFTGSAEDTLLHRGFTWTNFVSAASGKIVWINSGAFFNFDRATMDSMVHNQSRYDDFLAVFINGKRIFDENFVRVYASSQSTLTSPVK